MGSESIDRKPIQNVSQAALALERHYSVAEVAKLWALSEKTIRHMFEDEDGVLNWGASETRRKQRLKNRAPFLLPNSESAEPWTPNSQIETGFPRMGVCQDEYNQRQKRLPFLTGSVCVVGSVLAAA